MRLLYDNKVLNAEVTASSESAYYPWETAMHDTRLSRHARTESKTSQSIDFDLGAIQVVNYLGILKHNLSPLAEIQLQAFQLQPTGQAADFEQEIEIGDSILYYSFNNSEDIGHDDLGNGLDSETINVSSTAGVYGLAARYNRDAIGLPDFELGSDFEINFYAKRNY